MQKSGWLLIQLACKLCAFRHIFLTTSPVTVKITKVGYTQYLHEWYSQKHLSTRGLHLVFFFFLTASQRIGRMFCGITGTNDSALLSTIFIFSQGFNTATSQFFLTAFPASWQTEHTLHSMHCQGSCLMRAVNSGEYFKHDG